jgi:hypothetical protein
MPNFVIRSASANSAASPFSTPPSGTTAVIDVISAADTNRPRLVPAARNGASGFCDSSPRRADSRPETTRSAVPWR